MSEHLSIVEALYRAHVCCRATEGLGTRALEVVGKHRDDYTRLACLRAEVDNALDRLRGRKEGV